MTRQVMRDWAVDPQRVYVAGISAGAAMASIVAVSYPECTPPSRCTRAFRIAPAANVMEGVGAMAKGAADTARLARQRTTRWVRERGRFPRSIVHGEGDPVVRPVNAVQTRDAWLAMNALARGSGAGAQQARRTRVEHRRPARSRKECFGESTGGACEVETLLVAGLGHAWSGGSKLGHVHG